MNKIPIFIKRYPFLNKRLHKKVASIMIVLRLRPKRNRVSDEPAASIGPGTLQRVAPLPFLIYTPTHLDISIEHLKTKGNIMVETFIVDPDFS